MIEEQTQAVNESALNESAAMEAHRQAAAEREARKAERAATKQQRLEERAARVEARRQKRIEKLALKGEVTRPAEGTKSSYMWIVFDLTEKKDAYKRLREEGFSSAFVSQQYSAWEFFKSQQDS